MKKIPKVFVMDIWAVVPYYSAQLCRGLMLQGVGVTLGSMTYDLDPHCFRREGILNNPGLLDLVGRRRFKSSTLRKLFKLFEGSINLIVQTVRFYFARPDIIHVHQVQLTRLGLPVERWFLRLASKSGIKVVHTVHNLLPHDTGERHRQTFAAFYRKMDGLICHSEGVRQELIHQFGINPEKIWAIPHGPLFQSFPLAKEQRRAVMQRHTSDDEVIVVCQGIIRPYKGIPFLLDAWARVERAGRRARLVIAGLAEPAYESELRSQLNHLALKSVCLEIRFLPVEEMIELLQSADILVYPYREITSSGALMTGVVQQKAIVATDLVPFRQVLKQRENALLVEYGDSVGLAEALISLIDCPAERFRLAESIGKHASTGDPWINIARQTCGCYEAILSESRVQIVASNTR